MKLSYNFLLRNRRGTGSNVVAEMRVAWIAARVAYERLFDRIGSRVLRSILGRVTAEDSLFCRKINVWGIEVHFEL